MLEQLILTAPPTVHAGTALQLPCPPGTYNPSHGQATLSDCLPCEPGSYCLENASLPTGPCAPGYYCPTNITNGELNREIGSYGPTQKPCPGGTYQDNFTSVSVDDCMACPEGFYCVAGSAQPVVCDLGSYCPLGSMYPTPCPVGTVGSSDGLTAVGNCSQCPSGRYCNSPGLFSPRAPCDPGYVCYGGAATSTPSDGITGELCPAGGYCPLGSSTSSPCPPGTFSNTSGSTNTFGCSDCTPGFYCANARTPEPTGPCNAGYYCPGGAMTPNDTVTPAGHYTPPGSSAPVPCVVGSWMPHEAAGECYSCIAGYFCSQPGSTGVTLCPAGSYCPPGSDTPLPCPPSTYSNQTGIESSVECLACPPGFYCGSGGLTAPDGPCFAGHVCYGNSSIPNPVESEEVLTGGLCEAGSYCPAGSGGGIPCPMGTFSSAQALTAISECTACPSGRACNTSGLTAPSGNCRAGYYCISAAATDAPTDGVTGNICPPGSFCPPASGSPCVCSFGTYANSSGLEECLECPAGHYCNPLLGVEPVLCPAGYYCPSGSGLDFRECPVGTIGQISGLADESECISCPAGYFCDSPALTSPRGPCAAGYFCFTGATNPTPIASLNFGPCTAGHYCPLQSPSPLPCPIGTYTPSEYNENTTDCLPCDPGHFCASSALTAVGAECDTGFYCELASPSATPLNASYGDVCPVGHFCVAGSFFPQPCAPGHYSNVTGMTACLACPEGFYCQGATVNPLSFPCPPGHYCPPETHFATQFPCPISSYNPAVGSTNVSACLKCPVGSFCNGTGLESPSGVCLPGSFCAPGSVAPTGMLCEPGFYCELGAMLQTPCTPGSYCSGFGNSEPTGACQAGYFCVLGASTATPTDGVTGDVCPVGSFCEAGSENATACAPGTYGLAEQARNESEGCVVCVAGSYCGGYGLSSPSGVCEAGYYCPPGQSTATPELFLCPAGHLCLQGSTQPSRCASGTYQNQTGEDSCLVCPAGYFCDNSDVPLIHLNGSLCREGYYCPEGTQYATQFACPKGTYSNLTGISSISQCNPCTPGSFCEKPALVSPSGPCQPGYYCMQGSTVPNPPGSICSAGFYCPSGSNEPQPCPRGSYNPDFRQTSLADCLPCDAGHYCEAPNSSAPTGLCMAGYYCTVNSSAFSPDWLLCPAGHFCVDGAAQPEPCPTGSFSNSSGLAQASECLLCTEGTYCNDTGLTEPVGDCFSRYFCPDGSSSPTARPCPVGSYCPQGSADPLPCEDGTYANVPLLDRCLSCPAGSYCVFQNRTELCPAGFYCPNGTGADFLPCPRGTYSATRGLSSVDQCTACDAGHYCGSEGATEPSGVCLDGFYCSYAVDRSQPLTLDDLLELGLNITLLEDTNSTADCPDPTLQGLGGVCPVGHFCESGSTLPTLCPPGTYSDTAGRSTCLMCPAGAYCPLGTTYPADLPCPQGHYCEEGTEFSTQFPCPSGTFSNRNRLSHVDECLLCLNGTYCFQPGLSEVSGPCSAGYFCLEGAITPNPSRFSGYGGPCPVGFFCSEGTASPSPCPGGMYCERETLSSPNGLCREGYYCLAEALQPNPTDNITGNICPRGSYCPEGSFQPLSCPAGTYSNTEGIGLPSECALCTPGYYCQGQALTAPTGVCDEGYYCLAGQDMQVPSNLTCTPGHFCPAGTPDQIRCPSGTYQDEPRSIDCKTCPSGYFCNSVAAPVSSFENSPCPLGHYCLEGTRFADEFTCPIGTFNNRTNLVNISQCSVCTPGSACTQPGLPVPDFPCQAGYFCMAGAESVTPSQGETADRCPNGYYCEEGTVDPAPCPLGTFNPSPSRRSVAECLNCTGGSFCGELNLTAVQGDCSQGYYCDTGASRANWIECPAGFYCPVKSAQPTACPIGTFSTSVKLSSVENCIACAAGSFCSEEGAVNVTGPCAGGFYCPVGSVTSTPAEHVCPIGFHCPEGSATPLPCQAGLFTNSSMQAECAVCPERFHCLPANLSSNLALPGLLLCPQGYYCPSGTGGYLEPCPHGTFSNSTGLAMEDECTPCIGGSYCHGLAQTTPTGSCEAGYFCLSGVDTPTPVICELYPNQTYISQSNLSCPLHRGIGDLCPPGFFCPPQTAHPYPCPPGTHNPLTGQDACQQCPPGYFCPNATAAYTMFPCLSGSYCPTGSAYHTECPPGTFNPHEVANSSEGCLQCSPGQFCMGAGLSEPTGNCTEGWFCTGGAILPNSTANGGRCPVGYYCPAGSASSLPCVPGSYCGVLGLAGPQGLCSPGYYCINASTSPMPVNGIEGAPCSHGSYCIEGSSLPEPCPQGTYSNSSHNRNITDCLSCTAGQYCSDYGLTLPSGPCAAGYYCPPDQDQISPTPVDFACPLGHRCPEGSTQPLRCASGYYQPTTGQASCLLCPERNFCDNSVSVVVLGNSTLCPVGFYCLQGTANGLSNPCPPGTYSNVSGLSESSQCTLCDAEMYCGLPGLTQPSGECSAGYFCRSGASSLAPSQGAEAGVCPPGTYCPAGSPEPQLCPAATFSNVSGLRSVEECTNCTAGQFCDTPGLSSPVGECDAGYYCPIGSTSAFEIVCDLGAFCPTGSETPQGCPEGTYSNATGLKSVGQCSPCPGGLYCAGIGLTTPTGPCGVGFYCPPGQIDPQPADFVCPESFFCTPGSVAPRQCDGGSFTAANQSSECTVCPAGFYCVDGALSDHCPRGFYCPEGTGLDWRPCPIGTFSNQPGLSKRTQCMPCDPGRYCDQLINATAYTGDCFPGYYCVSGVSTPMPLGVNTSAVVFSNENDTCSVLGVTELGDVCPLGHYCPGGSSLPTSCEAGSYSNQTGLSECLECPRGYYCPVNTSDFTAFPCMEGYYCLNGTQFATQYQCPNGSFSNQTLLQDVGGCSACPAGYFCSGEALTAPTGLCSPGYYCSGSLPTASPANTSDLGGPCPAGFYCPEGSSQPIACDSGSFCGAESLSEPEGECDAGYFCTLGSSSSQPTDGTTGNVCPQGHYCMAGASSPVSCDPGTFSHSVGNRNTSDCMSCPPGVFCQGYGSVLPTAVCDSGFYCPGGQNSATPSEYICPKGHYCLAGDATPRLCVSGSFQDQLGQSSCQPCTAGYYCDSTSEPAVSVSGSVCSEGHYCPQGTRFASEHPCPLGTWSNSTGLTNASQCFECPAKYFCGSPGLSSPEGLCAAGFYCVSGSDTPTPLSGPATGDECPAGFYCLEGTEVPMPCPVGTFSNQLRLANVSECTQCTAGFYCNETGLVSPVGPCSAGYHCPEGSTSATALDCPAGYYCTRGASDPLPCPLGTYSPNVRLVDFSQCLLCTPGFFCDDLALTEPVGSCDEGFHCPAGSPNARPFNFTCPVGFACPENSSEPIPCREGTYSNQTQSVECSVCLPGFYCLQGLLIGRCPRGFFCPGGTGFDWVPCPRQTYSDQYGLATAEECTPCDGGSYCSELNATSPTGDCDAGFYCEIGNDRPNPLISNLNDSLSNDNCTYLIANGSICPVGSFCPAASVFPQACPAGTFGNTTGLAACHTCPAGYFCYVSSTTFVNSACPVGHYCPPGTEYTTQYPCPAGTLNNLTGLSSSSECQPCPLQHYCNSTGLSSPSGLCSPGWYCSGGASSSTPNSPTEGGGFCERGSFCPEGSAAPVLCTGGSYCDQPLLASPTGLCAAGYYCRLGSHLSTPVGNDSIGDFCPPGHYCPAGSTEPQPCAAGTFSQSIGNENPSDCLSCTPGEFCAGHGLSGPSGNCAAGYFCPGGQDTATPSAQQCPLGHHCPVGSHEPSRCSSGFYQDETGQSDCKLCPAGYFCDNTLEPVVIFNNSICLPGYFCPNGTRFSTEFPCPIGTYSNITGVASEGSCVSCSGGMFCDEPGVTTPTGFCQAGFFCRSAATSAAPMNQVDADVCPAGSYCPAGTTHPLSCPSGSFSNQMGLGNASECSPCPAGYFCQSVGLTAPEGECSGGFYCPESSASSSQVTCPEGHFCPNASSLPLECPIGTFSNATNLETSSECISCSEGRYCDSTGLTMPAGECDPGFYCPLGTNSSTPLEYECPIGSHCPGGTAVPLVCSTGSFTNTTQQSDCQLCPPGWYCESGLLCGPCPAGYFCLGGTSLDWSPCPVGTYSNQTGLSCVEQCIGCPGGLYCNGTAATSPSGECDAGYFCSFANFVPNPLSNSTAPNISSCLAMNYIGGPCPRGNYCPQRTSDPLPCSFGTYSPVEGLEACLNCPPGYFCTEASDNFESQPCPPGFYCPEGTMYSTQFPCPEGTFSNASFLTNSSQCEACTAGMFCASPGLMSPTAPCSPGWYCSGGASSSTPNSPTEGGGFCERGSFCPEGSAAPVLCTGGSYCDQPLLGSPTGLCAAGYYCRLGSHLSTPVGNDSIGDVCPPGHYCPAGSTEPQPCAAGTYSASTANTDSDDCLQCPSGMFCEGGGASEPTGNCSAGYYCPSGQSSATPSTLLCPAGHFCPIASSAPLLCPQGMYQNHTGQSGCWICPEGFVCDNSISPVVSLSGRECPPGSYCLNGTQHALQYLCPPGTYSNTSGLAAEEDCTLCDPGLFCAVTGLTAPSGPCYHGYYCQLGASTSTPNTPPLSDICPTGAYCPTGSVNPEPCPIGTFNPSIRQGDRSDCQNCTGGMFCNTTGLSLPSGVCEPGYYCTSGAENPTWMVCPEGHYCPGGSVSPQPCPRGTFSPSPGLESEDMCIDCLAGSYCNDVGLSVASGLCSAGYYCPGGANVPNPAEFVCGVGFHCPEGSSEEQPCPPGHFTNVSGLAACLVCPAGFFCLPVVEGNVSLAFEPCPQGYYCPEGTGLDWKPCPIGSFSNFSGIASEDECTPCTGGHYCSELHSTEPAGLCNAGFFCAVGSTQPSPPSTGSLQYSDSSGSGLEPFYDCSDAVIAGPCPVGHYCPMGSPLPLPCPSGTYNAVSGAEMCVPCPHGFFCLEGTSDFSPNICPSGYFCREGTRYDREFSCRSGTYNPNPGAANTSDCVACEPGRYCGQDGLSSPQGPCAPGWYCFSGASSPTPGNSTEGGQCLPGEYCPQGAILPTECDPGFYCSSVGLSNVTGACSAGYYCIESSDTPQPIDGVVGDVCPSGHYCPEQSFIPLPCPPGTFLNATGNSVESQCRPCTAGYFCGSPGLVQPEGPCLNGHYCPGGQNTSSPNEFICEAGHFCSLASPEPSRCPSGTYQDLARQSACKTCPPGFYCNSSTVPITSLAGRECLEGYYCPNGTKFESEFPCPIGTFSNISGLQSVAECTSCLGGYYCPLPALVEPFSVCAAGYYCLTGAASVTPREGAEANVCPAGSFCPEQSVLPTPCEAGTFSNSTGLQAESDCTNCTAGSFCTTLGLTEPEGLCEEGYYCPSGSSLAAEVVCPPGHYCEPGSPFPTPCPEGTFTPYAVNVNSSQCKLCTTGKYCEVPGLAAPTGNCSAGYYCPPGQAVSQPLNFICPVGLHCPVGSEIPLQCPSGSYTNITGESECEICPFGYFCLPVSVENTTLAFASCPAGYYCPSGTGLDWQPCPMGTYSNSTGLSNVSECTDCDGGMFCPELAATTPFGLCYEGHFCISGVDRPDPFALEYDSNATCTLPDYLGLHTGIGGVCPRGHFCPNGTSLPQGCSPGSYNNLTGQSKCTVCPAGFYCTANTSDFTYNICPEGYYCPAGTVTALSHPCPAGTFNSLSAQMSLSSCVECPPGRYCEGKGLSGATGPCNAGWYCSYGSLSPQPNDTLHGGVCSPGSFCPVGTSSPVPCTRGTFCPTFGLESPMGLCSAGYYCNGSAVDPSPSEYSEMGGPCPVGHYCPAGSAVPQACPPGTFFGSTFGVNVSDCVACSAGMSCDQYGLVSPTGNCSEGYYCPPGQLTSSPHDFLCPIGHFCPIGSHEPLRCVSGYHQNATGADNCLLCPAGFYCDNDNATLFEPEECPQGHYCHSGTSYATENPCSVGTFNNQTGASSVLDCVSCLGGHYCPIPGIVFPTQLCSERYFCLQGAISPTPDQDSDANICPEGTYCPEGTSSPLPCPLGTSSNNTMLSAPHECQLCTAGHFCNGTGLVSTSGLCSPGYYCPEGSNTPFQEVCTPGHFCEMGSPLPAACPVGTFSSEHSLSSATQCGNCTSGMFCNDSGLVSPSGPCTAGYYCPEGMTSSMPPLFFCPIGYICPQGVSSPQFCPSGSFTNTSHSVECVACPPGFYCTPELLLNTSVAFALCPKGYVCPQGTGFDLQPCPVGTYSNQTGLHNAIQCTSCDGGMYCAEEGAVSPSGACSPGYYCTSRNIRPDPVEERVYLNSTCSNESSSTDLLSFDGGICPTGNFCPMGSRSPLSCPAGTFSNETGLSACLPCPSGYYCPLGTSDFSQYPCLPGHYCPVGTGQPFQYPCQLGTFNNNTLSQNSSACIPCLGGHFCGSLGLATPSGLCSEGWFCSQGSTSATPMDVFQGGICPIGSYCPLGSASPVFCDGGRSCSVEGLTLSDGGCSAGFFCPPGSKSSTPAETICPLGHYCPGNRFPRCLVLLVLMLTALGAPTAVTASIAAWECFVTALD